MRSERAAAALLLYRGRRIYQYVHSYHRSPRPRNVHCGVRRLQHAVGTIRWSDRGTAWKHLRDHRQRGVDADDFRIRCQPAHGRRWDDRQLGEQRQHDAHDVGGRQPVVIGEHRARRAVQFHLRVGRPVHLSLPDSPEYGRHDRRAIAGLPTDRSPRPLCPMRHKGAAYGNTSLEEASGEGAVGALSFHRVDFDHDRLRHGSCSPATTESCRPVPRDSRRRCMSRVVASLVAGRQNI